MKLYPVIAPDGSHMRCPSGGGRSGQSLRNDSFFAQSRLTIVQLLDLVRDVALDDPFRNIVYRVNCTYTTLHSY